MNPVLGKIGRKNPVQNVFCCTRCNVVSSKSFRFFTPSFAFPFTSPFADSFSTTPFSLS
ncbi:unnamed protein product [Meloidogyne enterolobii]|uniref:Uncharacterized protein n=1 Tax=Meloidogyne enterolobii TaxID=390850 RepID=A0ACB0YR16_MELEN